MVAEPTAVWSSILQAQIPKRGREGTFQRARPKARVVIVCPNELASLVDGQFYVGRRMPFEAVVDGRVLRVDCHGSRTAALKLTVVLEGATSIDCSHGGSVQLPAGSAWLLASCTKVACTVLRRPRGVTLAALSEHVHPGKWLAAATVEVGVVAVFHVHLGKTGKLLHACPRCSFSSTSPTALARHFGTARWIGLPRLVTATGIGPPIRAPSRPQNTGGWRERFVRDSTEGLAVAWGQLPQLDPDELRAAAARAGR